jgi:hypothetical protein
MALKILNSFTRGHFALKGTLIAVTVVAAGIFTLGNPLRSTAEAACDNVNIIRCGLADGGTANRINSFRYIYDQSSDSGHTDLKKIYRWAGATDTMVANMNTTNTKLGTLYRNGDVKVDDKVVGTDAWISARFTEGDGFQQISSSVWARKTTTSFAQPSEPVLVHFNQSGAVDFVIAVNCGNAVKVSPPPQPKPQPKPELACVGLSKEHIGTTESLRYKFTATASAKNTTITRYDFFFGDGASNAEKVPSSDKQVSIEHEYAHYNTDYNAHVVVYSKDFPNGKTSADCKLLVHTPKKPPVEAPRLMCESLSSTNAGLDYHFTATAPAGSSVSAFVFNISDGITERVPTNQTSASIDHRFANYDTLYTVYATVTDGETMTPQTTQCTLQFKTPKQNECKPGIPVGDVRCTECKPGVPAGSPECTPTQYCKPDIPVGDSRCLDTPTPQVKGASTTLAKTGPGDIVAIFVGSTLVGSLLYRHILRRKFLS